MTKFYTRTGDDGTTGFLGEGRLPKSDLRMEALGTLDELSASLGLARSFLVETSHQAVIRAIQRTLYELMAEIAASKDNAAKFHKIDQETINEVEKWIDEYSTGVEIPQGFILPGETQSSAAVDLARAIARRAERRTLELIRRGDVDNIDLVGYLNRLSSFLFILEIKLIQESGKSISLSAQEK